MTRINGIAIPAQTTPPCIFCGHMDSREVPLATTTVERRYQCGHCHRLFVAKPALFVRPTDPATEELESEGMKLRCPACQTEVRSDSIGWPPVAGDTYRCYVCRLDLLFDPVKQLLVVTPLDSERRRRPRSPTSTLIVPPLTPKPPKK